jgi:hypothetical protein
MPISEENLRSLTEYSERLEDKVDSYHDVIAHLYYTIGELLYQANSSNLTIKYNGDCSVDEENIREVLSSKYRNLQPNTFELYVRALIFRIGTSIRLNRLCEKGMCPTYVNRDVLKEISDTFYFDVLVKYYR